MRWMVDLETLGVGPHAPIIQIGLAGFDDKSLISSRLWDVEPFKDSEYDYSTIMWWFNQIKAKVEAPQPGYYLSDALLTIHETLATNPPKEIWARSPAFDLVILREAFKKIGKAAPWSYRAERDCRTLEAVADMVGIKIPMVRVMDHNARADAETQAKWVLAVEHELLSRRAPSA